MVVRKREGKVLTRLTAQFARPQQDLSNQKGFRQIGVGYRDTVHALNG
jgi:hypothetical protein